MSAPVTPIAISDVDFDAYDEIIDVRTPKEFAEDRLPGAINLPVLDQCQHAEVGTLYSQVSAFDARKLGGALVSENIAKHLKQHFASKARDYKPLIYCWRGGQRSNAFALVLGQVGWPVDLVSGGYKAFRGHVRQALKSLPTQFNFRILSGLTGSGKTQLLMHIEKAGGQILDLEGLAHHQGSLLGQVPDKSEMGQKRFESRVWNALSRLDPEKPVWVEGESGKIGRVFIPQPLFNLLKNADNHRLATPLDLRVRNTLALYPHWPQNPDVLIELLERLKSRHGGEEIEHWKQLIAAGQFEDLVERLLSVHYDPSYKNPNHRLYKDPVKVFELNGLGDKDFQKLAHEVCRFSEAQSQA